MKKNREVSILLAGVLFLSALTGCGAGKGLPPASPTVKWINATYASLTASNGGNINLVGGYERSALNVKIVQGGLESSWSVTDRTTAEETMEWILGEGHRSSFAEELGYWEEAGFMDLSREEVMAVLQEDAEYTEEYAAFMLVMIDAYKEYGATAIDAWDYCRALQLLGWYAVAGYYTEEEALDQSLEIAKMIQETYGSWDELMESYLLGYHYWAEDDASDPQSNSAARRRVYEDLKAGKNNPYAIAWDTPLEKTWGQK